MMEVYIKSKHAITKEIFNANSNNDFLKNRPEINQQWINNTNILWIDLSYPTIEEIEYIAQTYNLTIPTKEEREEIEESARYWEEEDNITINSHFLIFKNKGLKSEIVTFIIYKNILFTIRYADIAVFSEFKKRLFNHPRFYEDGFDLLNKIFEMRVEKDADILEMTNKETGDLRRNVFNPSSEFGVVLEKLAILQDRSMSVRDSLFDKRRTIALLMKSEKADMDVKNNLSIVLKDLNSLIEYTTVNMNILDNIQGLFTNQINIEQNKTIKVFTVVTVAMMPPTLIASIYGMNFKYMPELDLSWGYPMAIGLMVISTILPILYFKKKGWLL